MAEDDRSQNLIALLQLAYSAERAAAYAYRGHWHSVFDEDERVRIRQIEDEEWHHRKLVGEMLESLGAHPSRQREIRACVLSAVCWVCSVTSWVGWLPCMARAGSRGGTLANMKQPRVTLAIVTAKA
jgi:demethoxyubiquinone hydroxylase (CLK1/Coq7/Cat5 family)